MATPETIKSTANSIGTSVKGALDRSSLKSTNGKIEDTIHSFSDTASEVAQQGYEMVAERARKVSDMAEKAYDSGVDYVKKNPGKALMGAATIGFLAAAFWRRRH